MKNGKSRISLSSISYMIERQLWQLERKSYLGHIRKKLIACHQGVIVVVVVMVTVAVGGGGAVTVTVTTGPM